MPRSPTLLHPLIILRRRAGDTVVEVSDSEGGLSQVEARPVGDAPAALLPGASQAHLEAGTWNELSVDEPACFLHFIGGF